MSFFISEIFKQHHSVDNCIFYAFGIKFTDTLCMNFTPYKCIMTNKSNFRTYMLLRLYDIEINLISFELSLKNV